MARVSIHTPKTPVTQKSNGVAANTLPNVCKMPGSPFTPVPLPNIARSSDSPQGYSQTVTIDGAPIALEGCSFGSQGDAASKGTGGGIISGNTCGPARFIGPGAFDVRIEGKGVHLLGDPVFNNCAPGGGAPNAATMAGIVQEALMARAQRMGIEKELQEICDMLCECEAEGARDEACLYRKMDAKEREEKGQGTIRTQVPYNMEPEDGGPPKPYMSRNEPWRATRNWAKLGSRRPDQVVVRDPAQEPRGGNIRSVIEVKTKGTGWRKGQERAYQDIGGGRVRLLVLDEETCKCPPRGPPVPPIFPARRAKDAELDDTEEKVVPLRRRSPAPAVDVSPVAALVGAAALVAAAVALVAAAPVGAAAAAAVAIVAVMPGSSQPTGGDDAI